ncbi:MAG: type II toxin-antitoxin system prevent-host-death family antitoxin [Polaromonas sp.]|nr:MAG: type II toxin-antitoxin system prevent-host-death family antitoxin [Polaromonas sp.]
MRTLAIAQAKNNFSAMLHLVESGQDVVLTRHGKAIARIIPELRAQVAPGAPLNWKALRDAGKKY